MKPIIQTVKRWVWRVVLWGSVILFLTTGISWVRAAFYVTDYHEIRFFGSTHIRDLRFQTARGGVFFKYGNFRYFKKGEKEGEYIPLTHEEFDKVFEKAIQKGWWQHSSSLFRETYQNSSRVDRELSPDDRVQNEVIKFKGMGMSFDWFGVWGTRDVIRPMDALSYQAMILAAPFWMLMVVFGVIPLFALCRLSLKMIRERRPKPGHCVECGYDLRAHVAGQRCPECGRVIVAGDFGDVEISKPKK